MIRYRLKCGSDHEFEAWFASSASYELQAADRRVCCPACGSRDVAKAIMAPHVAGRVGAEGDVSGLPRDVPRLLEAMRALRHELRTKTEDVGRHFSDEARKIHYGECEPRGIRGTASGEEARDLVAEGIEVFAFPPLPEDAN